MILAMVQASTAISEQYNKAIANYSCPYGVVSNGSVVKDNSGSYRASVWNVYNPDGGTAADCNTYTNLEDTVNYQYVDFTEQPTSANREFWVRLGNTAKRTSTPPGSFSAPGSNNHVLGVIGTTGNRLIASVSLEYNKVSIILYNVTTGDKISTSQVCLLGAPSYANTYDWSLDFRVLLDQVAGFVQVYNAAGTLLGEFLGPTLPSGGSVDAKGLALYQQHPNWPDAGNTPSSRTRTPTFSVLSNEPTFGIWVIPLLTAAAGNYQQQLSGSYADYSAYLTSRNPATTTTLEASPGQTKKVTYKVESIAAKNIPANYIVEAVALKTVFTAVNNNNAALTAKHLLRVDGADFAYNSKRGILPNITIASLVYQGSGVLLNTNPATSTPWSFSSIENMEIGFQLEG